MLAVAAQNVAISLAHKCGTLRVVERFSDRFQEAYWSIEDDHGVIEIVLSEVEAAEKVARATVK